MSSDPVSPEFCRTTEDPAGQARCSQSAEPAIRAALAANPHLSPAPKPSNPPIVPKGAPPQPDRASTARTLRGIGIAALLVGIALVVLSIVGMVVGVALLGVSVGLFFWAGEIPDLAPWLPLVPVGLFGGIGLVVLGIALLIAAAMVKRAR